MLFTHRCEYLASRARSSFFCVLKALTNAFTDVRTSSKIEQALVGSGILHHSFCFSVDGKNERALALLKLLQDFGRLSPERGQCLDIVRNINHDNLLSDSTFIGLFKMLTPIII